MDPIHNYGLYDIAIGQLHDLEIWVSKVHQSKEEILRDIRERVTFLEDLRRKETLKELASLDQELGI